MALNDQEIRMRLMPVSRVRTVVQGVENEVLEVRDASVVVRSSRTARPREITFSEIRSWRRAGGNGRIRKALAQVLGLVEA
jgi:hypothetical protein